MRLKRVLLAFLVWGLAKFGDCGLPLDTNFGVQGLLLPAFVKFRFKMV